MINPRAASPSADALKGEESSEAAADGNEGLIEIAEGNVVSAGAVFVGLDRAGRAHGAAHHHRGGRAHVGAHDRARARSALVAAPPVEADFLFEQRGLACRAARGRPSTGCTRAA